jgi:ABC-type Fe3+/spermidine/putrescine transport system ATPase subunit
VVLVTHDQDEAMDLSDRVAVMRAGRLQQVAAPRELYESPATAFVAGFVGESNLLAGAVASVEGELAVVRMREAIASGRRVAPPAWATPVLVLLRPAAAALSDATGATDDGGLVGAVQDVADPGPIERARVRLDRGDTVTVTRPRRAKGPRLREGLRIALSWPPHEARFLAPEL